MSNWSVAEKLSERVGCQKKIANNLIRLLTVEDNTPTFIGTDSKFQVVSAHRTRTSAIARLRGYFFARWSLWWRLGTWPAFLFGFGMCSNFHVSQGKVHFQPQVINSKSVWKWVGVSFAGFVRIKWALSVCKIRESPISNAWNEFYVAWRRLQCIKNYQRFEWSSEEGFIFMR